jgi:hypothetical protein
LSLTSTTDWRPSASFGPSVSPSTLSRGMPSVSRSNSRVFSAGRI